MEKDTIICRCEDVSEKEIVETVRSGLTTLDEIKRILRCGMGHCQGKICRTLIAQIIARETGKNMSEIEPPTTRPPFKPLLLDTLAKDKNV